MADTAGGGDNGWGELKWFAIVIGVLFFAWLFTGGYDRASKDDKFINDNEGLNTGNTYDKKINIFGETF